MNTNKFNLIMNSLDEELLLEAKEPLNSRKTNHHIWLAAAACIALLMIPILQSQQHTTASELSALGYNIILPETVDNAKYQLVKTTDSEKAKASFTLYGDKYTYEIVKTDQPTSSAASTSSAESTLSWRSNGLDLCMVQSDTDYSVSWYLEETHTQHTLSSTDVNQLLNTAREVLLLTGLELASAPTNAENIQYRVFSYQNLVIAETTFLYNDTLCAYRMAASQEITEYVTDISELDITFSSVIPANVNYCLAKLSFNPNQEGKIIWYDVVPGITYSLSVDSNATEELLLQLANELFEPAQGDSE